MKRRACNIFLLFLFAASFSYAQEAPSLSSDPASGDKSSPDEAITDPALKKERQIGRKIVEQIEEKWELIADPARLAHLSMIVDNLKPHTEREIPYEVRIVRENLPNAFCLPGGFVFFTSGMLALLHSDSEIAAIMAHEIIHVDQQHGMKMAAKANTLTLAALAVILLSGGALAPVVLAQVGQVALTSAYTIEFEKEADSKGLDLLIASGYPPTAMVTVMESFMHEEMKRPEREYGIYMDHPESVERVESMSTKLKRLGIALERKHPLRLLLISIEESGERLRLLIDGQEVWGGTRSAATAELLERAKTILDRDFQMELAPYDLQLEGNDLLRLKNNILAQPPLPEDMRDLSALRQNLLAALARAQKKHPIAKYFR